MTDLVAVLEFVPNEERISPPIPAGFALTMLASTPGGDAYTFPELVVMLSWPRWAAARSGRRLLMVAFGLSAVRWAIMASTSSAVVFVLVATLHGMSFGAYYLASVGWIAARTPRSLRATGQAVFVAATFGLGGLVGYLASGRVFDLLGGARLFALAAGVELVALVVVARLPDSPPAVDQ